MVVKFSSPNEIAPPESVILPFAKVRFPIAEPVAAVKAPFVCITPAVDIVVPVEP